MELSIGQVAKRSGISTRMLRHYDDLGLYQPSRVGENGYRRYKQSSLPRLYRIIALRRAGVSLPDIAQILNEQANEADALRKHLTDLRVEQRRLAELVVSIEEQIEQLENSQIDDPDAFRAMYRTELDALTSRLQERYPRAMLDSYADSAHTVENMTMSEVEHMAATGSVLMNRLAKMVADAVPPDSAAARELVAEHFAMVTQTVPLPVEAYAALGMAYRDDPLQRKIVESFHELLPEWLAQAIESFTNRKT